MQKAHHCRSSLYSASSSWTVLSRLASFRMALLSAGSFAEAWRSSRRLNTLLQHICLSKPLQRLFSRPHAHMWLPFT